MLSSLIWPQILVNFLALSHLLSLPQNEMQYTHTLSLTHTVTSTIIKSTQSIMVSQQPWQCFDCKTTSQTDTPDFSESSKNDRLANVIINMNTPKLTHIQPNTSSFSLV